MAEPRSRTAELRRRTGGRVGRDSSARPHVPTDQKVGGSSPSERARRGPSVERTKWAAGGTGMRVSSPLLSPLFTRWVGRRVAVGVDPVSGRSVRRPLVFHGEHEQAELRRWELADEWVERRAVRRSAPLLTLGSSSKGGSALTTTGAQRRGSVPGPT